MTIIEGYEATTKDLLLAMTSAASAMTAARDIETGQLFEAVHILIGYPPGDPRIVAVAGILYDIHRRRMEGTE